MSAGLLNATLIAFLVAIVVRWRDVSQPRFAPDRHVWVAVGTGVLVVLLSASMLLLGPPSAGGIARTAVHWVGIYAICGCAIPWAYALLVERAPLASIGITTLRLGLALSLNLALGLMMLWRIASAPELPFATPGELFAAAYELLVGGLFELFLYYGFIHLRLERAFGPVVAILGTAFLYSLWHVGGELQLHGDPWEALLMLFVVGVYYQSVFSIARNLLAIWPFFFLGGVMFDFLVVADFPEEIRSSPGWATFGWVAMLAIPAVVLWLRRRQAGS